MKYTTTSTLGNHLKRVSPRLRITALVFYLLGAGGVILNTRLLLPSFGAQLGLAVMAMCLLVSASIVCLPCIRWAHLALVWQLPHAQRQSTLAVVALALAMLLPITLVAAAFVSVSATLAATLLALCILAVGIIALQAPRKRHRHFFPIHGLVGGVLVQPWFMQHVYEQTPVFLLVMTGVDAILVAVCVLFWRRLCTDTQWQGWASPSTLAHQEAEPWAGWNRFVTFLSTRLHATWLDPLRARPDMSRLGPHHPRRSLRMALGGFLLPQTSSAQTAQRAPFAIAVLIGCVLAWLAARSSGMSGLQSMNLVAVLLASLLSSLFILATNSRLLRLFSRPNAEMPLLALLPHLQPADTSRRWILRTVTGLPMRFLALEGFCSFFNVLDAGANYSLLVLDAGLFVGNAACLIALPLIAWAGGGQSRRIHAWLSLVFSVLVAFTLIGMIAAFHEPFVSADANLVVGLTWGIFVLVLAGFGWQGWRRWKNLPHPFLILEPHAATRCHNGNVA